MEIITGKQKAAQKVVVYGPEGIGKSTFASQLPDPLFIDTEGSTKNMDVSRLPKPTSWQMVMDEIKYVIEHPEVCKTLIIDTVDWAEALCTTAICDKHQKKGIEDFGYGNGYVYVREEMGRFLNLLDEVIDRNINVALLAHAQIRKFEQPDEMGSYDRYELKLGKKTSSQTSPLIKEWADLVLFANYKTYAVAVDDKGKKHKAQGGVRVMYTTHHPCWDAKNRHGLAEELPFEYAQVAHIFSEVPNSTSAPVTAQNTVPAPVQNAPMPSPTPPQQNNLEFLIQQGVPKPLAELMDMNNVTIDAIQQVVADRGYFPRDTPISNYPPDFINGVLIGAWEQVHSMIEQNTLAF